MERMGTAKDIRVSMIILQSAAQAREEGQQALMAAKATEAEHKGRLQKIHADIASLRSKERQIAEVGILLISRQMDLNGSIK